MSDRRVPASLLWGLSAAVLVELVVLRMATRTFVNVPGLDVVAGPLRVVAEVGRLAFYVAAVLLAVAIGATALQARSEANASRVAAVVPLVVAVVAAVTRLGLSSDLLLTATVLVAVAALAVTASLQGLRAVCAVAFAVAVAASATGWMAPRLSAWADPGMIGATVVIAELAWLLWALSTPLLLDGRPSRTAVLWGVGTGLVVAMGLSIAGSPLGILVLWAFGLSGVVPGWLMGLGVAAAATTAVEGLRRRLPLLAAGVVATGAAGVAIVSSYQSTLAVVGISWLILAAARPAEAIDTRRRSRREDRDLRPYITV